MPCIPNGFHRTLTEAVSLSEQRERIALAGFGSRFDGLTNFDS
jgi:hypothetical protein